MLHLFWIFFLLEFFLFVCLKEKSIMTSHVIVHLIYRVDFYEINSWLVVATLLFHKLVSTKLVYARFFIQYLPLNMTFSVKWFYFKGSTVTQQNLLLFPNCKFCLFSSSRSSALFSVGSVSWRGQAFLVLSGCAELRSALVVLLMAPCFHVADGRALARKIQDHDGSVSHSNEW